MYHKPTNRNKAENPFDALAVKPPDHKTSTLDRFGK